MLYFFCYLLRAIRLSIVFRNGKFFEWLQFTGIFHLINRLVPFRLGEIASPVLIKSIFKINYAESIMKIIFIRIIDLILLIILSLFFLGISDFFNPLIIIVVLITFILLFLFMYRRRHSFYNFFFGIIVKALSLVNDKISQQIQNRSSRFKISRAIITKVLAVTFFEKLLLFSSFLFIAHSLGFNFGISKMLVAISMSNFTDLLPINSIGNFGTFELGWVAVLRISGVGLQESAESALLSHLLIFNFTLIIGIVCIILKFINYENKSNKTENR